MPSRAKPAPVANGPRRSVCGRSRRRSHPRFPLRASTRRPSHGSAWPLERSPPKWTPVRRKRARYNNGSERIDAIIDRLLEVTEQARALTDPSAIEALNVEIDRLATEVVRYAREREREREPDGRTMASVSIAIDTAKATVADCRNLVGSPKEQSPLRILRPVRAPGPDA